MPVFSRAIQFQVSDFYLEAYSPDRTISVDTQQCSSKTLAFLLDPKMPLAKVPSAFSSPLSIPGLP